MQRGLKDDEWLRDNLFGAAEMQQNKSKARVGKILPTGTGFVADHPQFSSNPHFNDSSRSPTDDCRGR